MLTKRRYVLIQRRFEIAQYFLGVTKILCNVYLHHLHKIFFLHKSLLQFVFFCSELNWMGICAAKMLKILW